MSYYLVDFTKEPNFDFDNLIIGKKINTDQKYSKYYIYYEENNIASELYIKLPKIRNIYNISNYKYNTLNLPIYPEYDTTNDFISFIKTLEENIIECFNKKKEFVSIINKKNSLHFIKINMFDDIKITSNTNKNITINDFKVNSELEIVIKINYIWSNQNKFGLSSQIYQIKYWAPPQQLEINFIDDEKPINKIIETKIYETININHPQPTINQPSIATIIPINKIIRPSLLDINQALKGLKKRN